MSGQQVATAPTRAQFKSLKDCHSLTEAFSSPEFMERIKASVPSHMKPSRLLRTFVQATSRAPLLLQCSMRSVLGAMLTCSEVGLEPNTPLQHAFLIPFGKYKWNKAKRERELEGYEVQLIFGYPGLLDLSYRSGHLTSVHADVVWKADKFSFAYGTDAHLHHVPSGKHEPEESPLWAYAHANLTRGQSFRAMPWEDVLRIRNASQGFRSALAAKEAAEAKGWRIPASWTEAPWVKHDIPMAQKTAFRNLSKWLPKSVEMSGAIALDEQQDRGVVDFSAVLDHDASYLDGGLPDAGLLTEEEPEHNAGAAFGLRTVTQDGETVDDPPKQDPPKADPPKADPPKAEVKKPEPRKVARNPDRPPPAESKPQETTGLAPVIGNPTFSAWLVNADGEPIDTEDGPAERFNDPVAYARALVNTLDAAFPADRELIRLANEDDANAAAIVSPEAAAILNPPKPDPVPVEEPPFQQDPTPEAEPQHDDPPTEQPWQLAPPVGKEWEAWNEKFGALLQTATTPDKLNLIIELNQETFAAFPPKFRIGAKTLIEGRQNALTTKATPAPPTFGELQTELIAAIDACKTTAEIDSLSKKGEIIRKLAVLKTAAPEMCETVQKHARTRAADLAKGQLGL